MHWRAYDYKQEFPDTMQTLSLDYVRDIRSQLRISSDVNLHARLRGIITFCNSRGGVIFFGLQDITGAILLVFEKRNFVSESWQAIRRLRASDFISVRGRVVARKRGPSVEITEEPTKLDTKLGISVADGDLSYRQVGGQIILSRLKNRICAYLQSAESVEIEPRLISIRWEGNGLEPLRIQYPGFGYNTYLAPTPFPQLLDTMIATALPRLHTIGKCFTTSYRDENSSTEACVIFGLIQETAIAEDLWKFLTGLIINTFADIETFPDNPDLLAADRWKRQISRWPPTISDLDVQTPTIQIFSPPAILARERKNECSDANRKKSVEVLELSRLIFPGKHVLIESSKEIRFGVLRIYAFSVHIERMIYLLEKLPLRMLRTSAYVMNP